MDGRRAGRPHLALLVRAWDVIVAPISAGPFVLHHLLIAGLTTVWSEQHRPESVHRPSAESHGAWRQPQVGSAQSRLMHAQVVVGARSRPEQMEHSVVPVADVPLCGGDHGPWPSTPTVPVRGVPWWGVLPAAAAPVLLAGGWTVAAALQPGSFNQIADTISALAAHGAADRW